MRISPVEAELLHADRWTDVTKVIDAYRSFANASKNGRCVLRFTSACSLYTGSQTRCWSYWFSYVMNSLVVCSLACRPAMVWGDSGKLWGASFSGFINTNQRESLPWKLFVTTVSPWTLELLSINFKYPVLFATFLCLYCAEEYSNLLKYHALVKTHFPYAVASSILRVPAVAQRTE